MPKKPRNKWRVNVIDIEKIKERLDYDPETGIFKWKIKIGSKINVGDIAGCKRGGEVRQIRVCGLKFNASHLAWLLHYGEYPKNNMVYADGDRDNLSIKNLRQGRRKAGPPRESWKPKVKDRPQRRMVAETRRAIIPVQDETRECIISEVLFFVPCGEKNRILSGLEKVLSSPALSDFNAQNISIREWIDLARETA